MAQNALIRKKVGLIAHLNENQGRDDFFVVFFAMVWNHSSKYEIG